MFSSLLRVIITKNMKSKVSKNYLGNKESTVVDTVGKSK